MIHTFEIYCSIDGQRAREILRYFGVPYWKSKFKGETDITGLATLSVWQRKEAGYWLLKLVVNPAKLLNGYDAFETITADQKTMDDLSGKFKTALSKIVNPGGLPELPEWLLRRIDYAADVRTQHVDAYVKLAQRGDKPANYKNKAQGKSGSCYLQCKSCTGNTYDKADQMRKNGKSPTMIARATGILRVEVQCNSPKVSYLRHRKNIESRELKYFFKGELAKAVLMDYCQRVYKSGDYHSFAAASTSMRRLGIKSLKMRGYQNVLRAVAQTRSINEARRQLSSDGMRIKNKLQPTLIKLSKETFGRKCKSLIDMNINPVTIPREWKIPMLPALDKLVVSLFIGHELVA